MRRDAPGMIVHTAGQHPPCVKRNRREARGPRNAELKLLQEVDFFIIIRARI